MNKTVVSLKAETRAQTDNHYNKRDNTTKADQQSSQDQSQNTTPSVAVHKKERATQDRAHSTH